MHLKYQVLVINIFICCLLDCAALCKEGNFRQSGGALIKISPLEMVSLFTERPSVALLFMIAVVLVLDVFCLSSDLF